MALTTGTGFLISSNGYVVTNNHVIASAKRLMVRDSGGVPYRASVVRTDPANDLALLKTEFHSAAVLAIEDSGKVRKGERVFTIGYPLIQLQGLDAKLTDGIVSGLSGMRGEPNKFQVSVPIQPGNSGGPLINEYGQVVGVIVSKLSPLATIPGGVIPENVNYAIKSNYLLELLRSESAAYARLKRPKPTKESLADVAARIEPSVVMVVGFESDNEAGSTAPVATPPPVLTPLPIPRADQPKPPAVRSVEPPSRIEPPKVAPPAASQAIVKFEPRSPRMEIDGNWEEIPFWSAAAKVYIDVDSIKTQGDMVSVREKSVHEYWTYVRYYEVDCWREKLRSVREVSFGHINKDDITEQNEVRPFNEPSKITAPLISRVCNKP